MVTYTIAEMSDVLKEKQFENFRFFEKQAVVNIVDKQTHIEAASRGLIETTSFLMDYNHEHFPNIKNDGNVCDE